MKQFLLHNLMIILPLCTMASVNNQPEINLVNVEDSVIPVKSRTSILEVAEMSLDRSDEAFAMSLEEVKNPYLTNEGTSSDVVEESVIAYDDASILNLIQLNFAPQIRGTLAKGDSNYLQLNGGGLLKEGDSFPVQIPQIKGRSFTITISEITTRGYTLKMNDVVQGVTFEQSSGIIKDSEK